MSTEYVESEPVNDELPAASQDYTRPRFASCAGADAHELEVYMPGVPKDGASVELVEDELTIVGRRRDAVPATWRAHFREQSGADYRLRVRLNIPVEQDQIRAVMEDGVLRLTLPIAGEAKPRQIRID